MMNVLGLLARGVPAAFLRQRWFEYQAEGIIKMNFTGKQLTGYAGVFALVVLLAAPVRANLTPSDHPGRLGSGSSNFLSTGSLSDTAATLSFTALGGPTIGHSWDALFYVHAPTSFTNLGVVVGTGGALEGSPSMFDFADLSGPVGGWSQFFGPGSGSTGGTALSFGPSTNDLFWATHFAGNNPSEQSFSMTLFSFNDLGSNIWDGAVADWDGTSWSMRGVPDLSAWEAFRSTIESGTIQSVPLPSAALLGVLGLGCVATLRKRFV